MYVAVVDAAATCLADGPARAACAPACMVQASGPAPGLQPLGIASQPAYHDPEHGPVPTRSGTQLLVSASPEKAYAEFLQTTLKPLVRSSDDAAFLLDGNGAAIAAVPRTRGRVDMRPVAGGHRSGEVSTPEGKQFFASAPVGGSSWRTVLTVPESLSVRARGRAGQVAALGHPRPAGDRAHGHGLAGAPALGDRQPPQPVEHGPGAGQRQPGPVERRPGAVRLRRLARPVVAAALGGRVQPDAGQALPRPAGLRRRHLDRVRGAGRGPHAARDRRPAPVLPRRP